ncbi:alpha/beta hydrolase, partial [Candidatus Bathyarchaeota archaeon]|nr:alpha/beta hydrolase [Candidatus Bathyarchaeota archaeon]
LATNLWPYLERVNCPVQLLKGVTSDLVTPKTRARIEKMSGFEIIDVEGTGHMIPQDVPEKFEELVRKFLKSVY